MKTKSLLFIFLFLAVYSNTLAQLTLTIEISALRSDRGYVWLSLFDEAENQVAGVKGEIKNSISIIKIDGLKPAKYAFKYFHDENNSNGLDFNKFGMPLEGYGFSNDAKGFLGPPSFHKMIFDLPRSQKMHCLPNYLNN